MTFCQRTIWSKEHFAHFSPAVSLVFDFWCIFFFLIWVLKSMYVFGIITILGWAPHLHDAAGKWATQFAPRGPHRMPLSGLSGCAQRRLSPPSLPPPPSPFQSIAPKSPAPRKLRGPAGFPGNLRIIQNHTGGGERGPCCREPLVPARALAHSGVNLSAWASSSANWGITTHFRGAVG